MQCPKCERPVPDDANLCCYCGRVFVKRTSRRSRPNGSGTARNRGASWQSIVVIGWKFDQTKNKYIAEYATKGGFRTKKEALEYCPSLKLEATAKKKGMAPPKVEARTVEYYWEIAKSQMEKQKIAKLQAYKYAYDKLEPVQNRDIDSLTVKELQAIVDEKAKTHYPARDMRTVLSKVYELALVDEIVQVNKAKSIELPRLEEEESVPFTEDELKKQWDAYEKGHTFVGYILLMDYTGMMPGELLDCKKSMIDFDNRRIVGAGKKTEKRRKSPIVYPDFIDPVLRDLCEFSPSEKLVCMNKDNFYKKFKAVMGEIGCRNLPPYSCRHTTGTALALGGAVAPSTIQKVMRHSKFSSTQRYIHPSFDDAAEAVNKLERP